MNVQIVPAHLRELRASRDLSQARLGKLARVNKRQIQRIEASQEERLSIREETLRRLAEALRVSAKVLAGDSPVPEFVRTREQGAVTRQVTLKLDQRTQLNYDLVEARYGASFKDLVNLAPVLFVLLAEKAMKRKEVWVSERLGRDDVDPESLQLHPGEGDDTQLLRSVEIFGVDDGSGFEFLDTNHLVDQLSHEIEELDDSLRARFSYWEGDAKGIIAYHPGDRVPETEVCRHELLAITCRDPAATSALTLGPARIRDIPNELLRTDKAIERITWLRRMLPVNSGAAQSLKAEGGQ